MAYQAKGDHLDEEIKKKSATDHLAIQQAKSAYIAAQEAGDAAGMAAAHAAAEAVRSKYGYSGGEDGSERIELEEPAPQPTVTYRPVVISTPADGGYSKLVQQVYSNAQSAADSKLEAEQRQQERAIRAREEEAFAQRNDGARQAALLRAQQRRDLEHFLSSKGLTGGASETAALQVEQEYGNALRQLDADYSQTRRELSDQLADSKDNLLEQRAGLYSRLAESLVPDYLTAVRQERQDRLDAWDQGANLYRQQLALAAQLAEYGDFSIYEQLGADITALKDYFKKQQENK